MLTSKIKELVLLAQEQGYLTHDDVSEHLPKDKVTPADIEMVESQFEQLEISVVDQAEVDNVSPIRRGEDDKAKQLLDLAVTNGYEPQQKTKVEPMTLKALYRERVEAGLDMPSESFSLFVKDQTKISRK